MGVYWKNGVAYHIEDPTPEERKRAEREQTEFEAEEIRRKQAKYEASLILDDFGNKYEQVIVDGKLTLRLVESADGTLNI